FATTVAAMSLFVAACAGQGAAAAPSPTSGAAAATPVSTLPASPPPATSTTASDTPTAVPATTSSPTTAVTPTSAAPTARAATPTTESSASPGIKFAVASGTEANFRVREQLARLNLPSDAIGKTSAVTGSIVIGEDGKVVADQSKFVVDLTTLKSDSNG